jgi:hypothetical protein
MSCISRVCLALLALAAALPLLALADSASSEQEQNQRQLDKWRTDSAHYNRLLHDLKRFLSLPPEKQERLRQLDRALHEEDSAGYARLRGVLDRYADWLRRLPEADRGKIEAAANTRERIQLIRELREREWVEKLPLATREALRKLPAEQQPVRIAALRREERQFREEWRTAFRHWDELMRPRPQVQQGNLFQNLEPELKTFIAESLAPLLSPEEKERLRRAQGQWPLFPKTLVELADKHPIRFPPAPVTGPTRFDDLPPALKTKFPELKDSPPTQIKAAEGKWPDYPLAVLEFARPYQVRPWRQMGPCRPEEFASSVREFHDRKLVPILSDTEKDLLKKAEGHWPQYPRVLVQLSRKHGLQLPGMMLPGPRQLWDTFRTQRETASSDELPEVPDHALLEFVRDMEPQERSKLPSLSLDSPTSRALLKQAYFQKNPAELQRIRQADLKKKQLSPQKNQGKPKK